MAYMLKILSSLGFSSQAGSNYSCLHQGKTKEGQKLIFYGEENK